MEASTYAVEDKVEATHWWFVGRRRLFLDEIRRAGVPKQAAILDVGSGTGTNLRMLRDAGFTRVAGLDFSADAIRFCAAKALGRVERGDVCAMPFADASFDFVLASDIIEHVTDDARAVREIARVLRPGGVALITVPAFMSLWGLQDDRSQHRRRYRLEGVLEPVRAAGLIPERRYYFNSILFGPIWVARRMMKAFGVGQSLRSENEINTPALNAILVGLFRLDVATAPWLRPPFGVSILVLARKPG